MHHKHDSKFEKKIWALFLQPQDCIFCALAPVYFASYVKSNVLYACIINLAAASSYTLRSIVMQPSILHVCTIQGVIFNYSLIAGLSAVYRV